MPETSHSDAVKALENWLMAAKGCFNTCQNPVELDKLISEYEERYWRLCGFTKKSDQPK